MRHLLAILLPLALACSERRESPTEHREAEPSGAQRSEELIRQAAQCEPSFDRRDAAACRRACDLGHSNSCAQWAAALEERGERAEAQRQFELACRGGSGVGCDGAARLSGDEKYLRSARNYHRVHCEQGYARSCAGLAAHYDRPGTPHHDPSTARHWRQSACRLGFKPACASTSDAHTPN